MYKLAEKIEMKEILKLLLIMIYVKYLYIIIMLKLIHFYGNI